MVRRMFRRLARKARAIRHFWSEAYYTLNGWRFADLKNYVDQATNVNEDAQFAFTVMRQEIASLNFKAMHEVPKGARLAMVTCLPPDASGIARYSFEHALASHEALDVFSPVRDPSYFMLNAARLKKNGTSDSNLFPINTLLAMDELHSYDHVIFVIGNSNHNIEIYQFMEKFVKSNGSERAICYLHDPCCHNIVQMAKRLSHSQYYALLQKLYADRFEQPDEDHGATENWQVHQIGIDRGMLGARAILDIGIHRFIVNSGAAAGILGEDFREADRSKVTISSLYHPVFPLVVEAPVPRDWKVSKLVLGTFGLPGYSKRTDVVVEAAMELRERGHEVRLIIAGYNAAEFSCQYFRDTPPPWIELSEPHTEHELQQLMTECDIAVQLRERNLGESSGIVPTLLAMRKTVIVSPIGSFGEYDQAAIKFDADSMALADLLESHPSVDRELIGAYVDRHDLSHFSRDFVEAVFNRGIKWPVTLRRLA